MTTTETTDHDHHHPTGDDPMTTNAPTPPVTEMTRGTLAYYDSFVGMVKVRVLARDVSRQFSDRIIVEVTADHQTYKRGEKLHVRHTSIVPRHAYRGGRTIMPYRIDWTPLTTRQETTR